MDGPATAARCRPVAVSPRCAGRSEAAGELAFEEGRLPLLHALLNAFLNADTFHRVDVGHGSVPLAAPETRLFQVHGQGGFA